MVIKVGINGFGRIGRVIFRTCFQSSDLEITAVNDPAIDVEYICYLIKFDSTHGKFKGSITHTDDEIKVNESSIKIFHQKQPTSIQWKSAGVQYVIEASGMFTNLEKASGHLVNDGVKRVIVTAPSVDIPMIILGVNDSTLNSEHKVLSCASSTLYCLAPIIKVLESNFGVAEGFITSIHAMTPSLKPLDGLCVRGKHWRDHRSIHQNIIPATTGACKALGKIIPQVKDKLSGLAFRVPIVNVSVLDLTIKLKTNTTLQEIVNRVEKERQLSKQNIIKCSNENVVSSDFIGENHSCILDIDSSLQLTPNFFKLVCWYENEYSYACRVVDTIFFSEKQLQELESQSKMIFVRARSTKRHDMIQQTESCKNEMPIDCNHTTEVNSKILCNNVPNNKLNMKSQSRHIFIKKPLYSHNCVSAPSTSRDNKKRQELIKIWNDDTMVTPSVRQNRNSFFQSCIAFTPRNSQNDSTKAHERLEKVKKEFSKMVNITEDLLRKSYTNQFNTMSTTPTKEVSGTKVNDNLVQIENNECKKNYTDDLENCNNQKPTPVLDISGDCSYNICTLNSEIKDNFNTENTKLHEKTFLYEKDHEKKEENPITNNFSTRNIQELSKVDKAQIILCANVIQNNKQIKVDKNMKNTNESFKNQIVDTISNLIHGLSDSIKSQDTLIDENNRMESNNEQQNFEATEYEEQLQSETETKVDDYTKCDTNTLKEHTGYFRKLAEDNDNLTKIDNREDDINDEISEINNLNKTAVNFNKVLSNTYMIDEELKKRNIILISSKEDCIETINKIKMYKDDFGNLREADEYRKGMELTKQILKGSLSFNPDPIVIIPENTSRCPSPINTITTMSNGDINRNNKQDIYDKLDSASGTDSENSFQINERRSQVINITDLTNSLEDLARLDKICRIIEISDELSDELFSALDNNTHDNEETKKWSFRDLCERIKLDDFCKKVFGKSTV